MTIRNTSPGNNHSWDSRMQRLYGNPNESQIFKYWDGTMSEENKKKHQLTWTQIDEMAEALLKDGYRIVKYSTITPKGEFSLHSTATSIEPKATNLFFELEFNEEEFKQLYQLLGRYQNNFPDYFKAPGDYEKYCATHDLWVLEDIKTHGPTHPIPVGFATFCFDDSKDGREEFHVPENQRLLYHDTVVIDPDIQGSHVGMRFMNITDAYYLRHFGTEGICYGLCTGEINTSDVGQLSLKFHEKRGFGDWIEYEAPFKKWKDRYGLLGSIEQASSSFMIKSYRGKTK